MKALYAITDPKLIPAKAFAEKAEACLAAGCGWIQFRDKSHSDNKQQQAELLRQLCDRYQAKLIINDDIELALKVNADGVHLGMDDLEIFTARNQVNNDFIIGATCHNSLDTAQHATQTGADYLAFGRFFPSKTKPSASMADTEIIGRAKSRFGLPIVAIGGINRDNAGTIIERGADAIAVCHDIFSPDDPREIERRVKQYFKIFS